MQILQISCAAVTHSAMCAVLCCDVLCSGDPIPRVEYTPEEVQVWGTALSHLKALYPLHACKEFNTNLAKIGFR